MRKFRILLALGFFFILISMNAKAQIGIAVAEDENGSSIKWQVVWNKGNSFETEQAAKRMLKAEGYDKVYTLSGGEKRGHHLTSGYWVVVEANHKIYDGTFKRSYGLGASSSSYSEAEQRAVSNLSQYDGSWDKSDGYEVDKRGVF